jgi:hypothetical protein
MLHAGLDLSRMKLDLWLLSGRVRISTSWRSRPTSTR